VYGDGRQLRNISYVEDSVAALVLAAIDDRSNEQVFFAVADRQYNVAEIAQTLVENIGGTARFVDWPADRKAIEFGDAVISNQKIKTFLNWAPLFDLQSGLVKTKDYFRSYLKHYIN